MMSATQVSIRLGLEGKAEVKRGFEEVGRAGTQAFGEVERSLVRTGVATERETARLKRLAEAARLATAAEAAQARFDRVLGVERGATKSARASAETFEAAAREAEHFDRRAKALKASLDPLAAAQDRLNAELAEYAALAKRGSISVAEHAAANALAKARFDQTAQALKGVGDTSKLSAQQVLTLQYTMNDVIASLSTGTSPLTILMQQGGQVTQAFGGVTGTLKTLGGALGAVGGTIAGVAVAVGLLAAAWASHDTSTRAVATALAGIGRSSGATAAELERLAHSSAEAGKVSVAAARAMQVAFLATGRIGATEMAQAVTVARDLGATLGVTAEEAARDLARALADPVKGADELSERLRFLDDRTRQHVRTLAEQNRRAEAQRLVLDALRPALADAEQATNALGRAWAFVTRQASNALDAIGRAVDRAVLGPSPAEELDRLRRQRERLSGAGRGAAPALVERADQRIAVLERQLARERVATELRAGAARANEQSVRGGETARDLLPGARDLERLRQQEAALRTALAEPAARARLADVAEVERAYQRVREELARYRDGLGAATAAADAFRSSSEVAARALSGETDAIEAAIRATLALARAHLDGADAAERAEARRQGLVEQARSGIDAEVRARQALRERIAEQTADGARQAAELARQGEAQRRVNDAIASGTIVAARAQQALQVEQALRPLITAHTLAEGEAKEVLTRVLERMREAYARLFQEQARGEVLSDLEDRRREIELLQRQIALVGQSVTVRSEALALLRAEQDLRRRGIDLSAEEARATLEAARRIEASNRTLRGRELVQENTREIALLERQIALVRASVAVRSEELAVLRARNALIGRGVDPESGEGRDALAQARRLDQLQRTLAGREALEESRQEIALLETQIALVGRSASERGLVLATLRAEQDLRRRGIDLASEEGRALIENAGRIERLTQQLQRQEAAQRALENAIGSAFDRFGTLIAQGKTDWKSWADAGRAALGDIMNELVRLSVTNPLRNALFGSNAPTLNNAGGLLGSLFGNLFGRGGLSIPTSLYHAGGLVGAPAPLRSVPAALIAGAPRLHAGAYLKPDEVPAILQRGERVLSRKETAAYERDREHAAPTVVTFNITTPDAGSFRRAQGQITAEMASALERARRNL